MCVCVCCYEPTFTGLRKQARNENNKKNIYNGENVPRFDKKKKVNYGKGISPI